MLVDIIILGMGTGMDMGMGTTMSMATFLGRTAMTSIIFGHCRLVDRLVDLLDLKIVFWTSHLPHQAVSLLMESIQRVGVRYLFIQLALFG